MPSLQTTVCGIKMKNPLVLASAPTAGNAELIRQAFESGVGAVVAKSVSADPDYRVALRPMFTMLNRKGYPHSFSNYSSGFASELTPEAWQQEMRLARRYAEQYKTVLIGSIFNARSLSEWSEMAKLNEDAGVHMIELDLSCPSTTGTRAFVAGGPAEAGTEVINAVVSAVKTPIFAKLTAEAADPVAVAQKCKEVGASGVTVLNRFPSLDIDIKTGRPLLAGRFAGVGGPWMMPIMLKWVARLASEVGLPVSASNGIWTWQDIIKAIMCGASTVQTCTAVMFSGKGFGIIPEFLEGLEEYLRENNLSSLDQIRGTTLPQIRTFENFERRAKGEVWAEVETDKCGGCRRPFCYNSCFHGAVRLDEQKKATVERELCEGCGLCSTLCPKNAIKLAGKGTFALGN